MSDTKKLNPEFAEQLWQQWESFSDNVLPILEDLNEKTRLFLADDLHGDFAEALLLKQLTIFDGAEGFIDHVNIRSYEMKQGLKNAAEEICGLDLLLSKSYEK